MHAKAFILLATIFDAACLTDLDDPGKLHQPGYYRTLINHWSSVLFIVAICQLQLSTPPLGSNLKSPAICQTSIGLVGGICAPGHDEAILKSQH